jgi:hypothetical protein
MNHFLSWNGCDHPLFIPLMQWWNLSRELQVCIATFTAHPELTVEMTQVLSLHPLLLNTVCAYPPGWHVDDIRNTILRQLAQTEALIRSTLTPS